MHSPCQSRREALRIPRKAFFAMKNSVSEAFFRGGLPGPPRSGFTNSVGHARGTPGEKARRSGFPAENRCFTKLVRAVSPPWGALHCGEGLWWALRRGGSSGDSTPDPRCIMAARREGNCVKESALPCFPRSELFRFGARVPSRKGPARHDSEGA